MMDEPKVIRIVCFPGGFWKIYFQIGVMEYAIEVKGLYFNGFTGVSCGNIMALMLTPHAGPDGLRRSFHLIRDVAMGIEGDSDIYTIRGLTGSVVEPLVAIKSSVYSFEPLRQLFERNLDFPALYKSDRDCLVGTVSYNNGDKRYFDPKGCGHADIPLIGTASACVPVVGEPWVISIPWFDDQEEEWKTSNELHGDGGVRETTPLKQAIEMGRMKAEALGEDVTVEIHLVMTSPGQLHYVKSRDLKAWYEIGLRSLDMMSKEIQMKDVGWAQKVNRVLQWYHRWADHLPLEAAEEFPLKEKIGVDLKVYEPPEVYFKDIHFDKDSAVRAMEGGRQVAQQVLG